MGVGRVTTADSLIVNGVVVAANTDAETWSTSDATRIEAVSAVRPIDPAGAALVAEIRGLGAPAAEVLVGGLAANESDATSAVVIGLQRTGRIVTAAALLIAIVFASFLTSGATNIKQLGFGDTIAILLDATVVRALLVPSFMHIAGKANWWAPGPLRRLHSRVGLKEG